MDIIEKDLNSINTEGKEIVDTKYGKGHLLAVEVIEISSFIKEKDNIYYREPLSLKEELSKEDIKQKIERFVVKLIENNQQFYFSPILIYKNEFR